MAGDGLPDDLELLLDGVPTDGRNYVAVGAETAFRMAGVRRPGFAISVTQRVPVSRGLGSSAVALVGGAMAANALLDEPVDEAALVFALAEVEGHAEQLAACMFGGLVAVAPPGDPVAPGRPPTPSTFALEIAPELVAAIAVPAVTLETKEARAVLPHEVPFADAVTNMAALTALCAGLADCDAHLVGTGMRDRLHQDYRAELLPASLDVLAAARSAGAMGACWSGAGPTMIGICDDTEVAAEVAEAMAAAFGSGGIAAAAMVAEIDLDGTVVTEIDGEPFEPSPEDIAAAEELDAAFFDADFED